MNDPDPYETDSKYEVPMIVLLLMFKRNLTLLSTGKHYFKTDEKKSYSAHHVQDFEFYLSKQLSQVEWHSDAGIHCYPLPICPTGQFFRHSLSTAVYPD